MFTKLLFIFSCTSIVFAGFDFSQYPAPYRTPPINATWTQIFLQGKNISTGGQFYVGQDKSNCTKVYTWSPTYDDGPSPYSQLALNALAARNVKATFFVTGTQVTLYPDVLIKIYEAGHAIGIHTWSHPYLTNLTNDEILTEMLWTAKVINDVLGIVPTFMRPPYGDLDDRVRSIMNALGLDIVLWNRDTFDWEFSQYVMNQTSTTFKTEANISDPTQIPGLFTSWGSAIKNESIVSLQHDLYEITAKEIEPALDALMTSTNNSYEIVDIIKCHNLLQPYTNALLLKADISLLPLLPPPLNYSGSDDTSPKDFYYFGSDAHSIQISWVLMSVLALSTLF